MTKYSVLVKPGSSQEKIVQTNDYELTIYLHARAHDGEANTSLIKLLAKYFDVPKTSIQIVSGQKSRTKIIKI